MTGLARPSDELYYEKENPKAERSPAICPSPLNTAPRKHGGHPKHENNCRRLHGGGVLERNSGRRAFGIAPGWNNFEVYRVTMPRRGLDADWCAVAIRIRAGPRASCIE